MTREDRLAEIEDYVQYLDAVYADVFGVLDRALVTAHALGFSQGASTVSRWVALGKAKIDRLILWGGEFPPDLDLTLDTTVGRLRAARLALVYGRSDEDRKSTRLNSSHRTISYAVFCLKKKK